MQLAFPRSSTATSHRSSPGLIPRVIPGVIPRHRAVIGGLLIAMAAALAFVAASGGGGVPGRTVIVASRAIAPGTRVAPSDLELRSGPISADLAANGFTDLDELLAATTVAPVGAGEIIQHSAVRTDGGGGSGVGLSFPIDREHALDGDLRPGDTVDVLATFGSGLDAETAVLARSVRLAGITTTDATSVTGAGRLVITATFTDTDQLLDVAHAAQSAALTLVRTTGAVPGQATRSLVTSPGATPTFGAGTTAQWGMPGGRRPSRWWRWHHHARHGSPPSSAGRTTVHSASTSSAASPSRSCGHGSVRCSGSRPH